MRLQDVCTLFVDGDWIESKDQSESGIRLIQTGNIGEGSFIEKDGKEKYISVDTFNRLGCTEIYSGDILISRLPEPVGRGCIIPQKEERLITAVDCTICRINEDIVDKRYFCYYLQSPTYYTQLEKSVTGTTRKRISRKNLGSVEINIPDREVQLKVVDVFDRLTRIIDGRNRELEELDSLIKARFVEMFGDRWSNSMNWHTQVLREVTDFYNGQAHEKVIDENGEYILVTSRCIASDKQDVRRTNAPLFSLHIGDICMVMSDVPKGRALAKCILIDKEDTYTLNQRICCFRNYMLNPIFFLYLLNRHEYFLSFDDGDSQTNLRKDDLLNCSIIIPPLKLQNKFSDFVQQVDKLKAAVQKDLEEAQTLFDSLMQEYFG